MRSHLLSIFPVRGYVDYARVYLTPIEETAAPLAVSFSTSREKLASVLRDTSIEQVGQKAFATGESVQIAIDESDALLIVSSVWLPISGAA